MHFTFFTLKRTYLRSLHKVQWPMMAKFGLTPARFDLLYILTSAPRWYGVRQSRIREILGVSAPTVSKMLDSLEELELVVRRPDMLDRRRVIVSLTLRGRAWMKRVMQMIRLGKRGPVQWAAHSIFIPEWWKSRWENIVQLESVDKFFGRLRRLLMDEATLHYKWHPDS